MSRQGADTATRYESSAGAGWVPVDGQSHVGPQDAGFELWVSALSHPRSPESSGREVTGSAVHGHPFGVRASEDSRAAGALPVERRSSSRTPPASDAPTSARPRTACGTPRSRRSGNSPSRCAYRHARYSRTSSTRGPTLPTDVAGPCENFRQRSHRWHVARGRRGWQSQTAWASPPQLVPGGTTRVRSAALQLNRQRLQREPTTTRPASRCRSP